MEVRVRVLPGEKKKKPTLGPFYLVNMSRDAICSNMSRPFALGVCEFDTSVDCVSAVTSNPLSGIEDVLCVSFGRDCSRDLPSHIHCRSNDGGEHLLTLVRNISFYAKALMRNLFNVKKKKMVETVLTCH